VLFQHLLVLVAALVLIPLVAAGVATALDRSHVASAKIWADRPAYTPKFSTDRFASYETPAQVEAGLMKEMVDTDSFVDAVLKKTEPQYASWSLEHRRQAAVDLRSGFSVDSEAEHLFVISFRSARAEYGVVVLKALIDAFTAAVQDLESGHVATAQNVLQGQLNGARQDMNTAVGQAESYRATHGLGVDAAHIDPVYAQLQGQARTKTDRYLAVLAQVDEAQASRTAVTSIQASIFHVVDPPAAAPQGITRSSPAVRYSLTAGAGIALLEALLVYVLARRDPSVRSLEEVRREVGLRPLGSTPVLGRR
jgi:uncharacterized protein involved in exopolysaccharide biosynthesis